MTGVEFPKTLSEENFKKGQNKYLIIIQKITVPINYEKIFKDDSIIKEYEPY